jgi:RNA polymerase sigma-70 factor (ECF subfamily)
VQRGDDDAFGQLFDRHADALFRYCMVRLRCRENAQDVVSYVFGEAWRQRHHIELQGDSLRPWLFSVARNRTGRLQTQILRRGPARSGGTVVAIPDHAERVVDRVDSARLCEEVLDAIDTLPAVSRDVLTLSVWGGLSYEQIAEELGVEVGTVKSRLNRARQRLAPIVDPDRSGLRRRVGSDEDRTVINLFTPGDST